MRTSEQHLNCFFLLFLSVHMADLPSNWPFYVYYALLSWLASDYHIRLTPGLTSTVLFFIFHILQTLHIFLPAHFSFLPSSFWLSAAVPNLHVHLKSLTTRFLLLLAFFRSGSTSSLLAFGIFSVSLWLGLPADLVPSLTPRPPFSHLKWMWCCVRTGNQVSARSPRCISVSAGALRSPCCVRLGSGALCVCGLKKQYTWLLLYC